MGTIYKIWMMRHVDVPEEISSALASRFQGPTNAKSSRQEKPEYIPMVAVVNGRSTRTTPVPAGAGRYRLQVNSAQREAAQADAGDVIKVDLRLDTASRTLPAPADLAAGLKEHPKALKTFQSAPPGFRRQFIQWFDSARAPETRAKRLDRAIEVLLERALLAPDQSRSGQNIRSNRIHFAGFTNCARGCHAEYSRLFHSGGDHEIQADFCRMRGWGCNSHAG
ncbi:MAG TPA: YdeI/OmpD-associated family protein [Candidatus Acidoferrales bacterium]|nr:YdeI/OmpD-associated family protein [Candidatus Acidoferrales bacterium]